MDEIEPITSINKNIMKKANKIQKKVQEIYITQKS